MQFARIWKNFVKQISRQAGTALLLLRHMHPEVCTGGALEAVSREVSPERLVPAPKAQQPYRDAEYQITRVREEPAKHVRLIDISHEWRTWLTPVPALVKREARPKPESLWLVLLAFFLSLAGLSDEEKH
jgi:hypothetical protein